MQFELKYIDFISMNGKPCKCWACFYVSKGLLVKIRKKDCPEFVKGLN